MCFWSNFWCNQIGSNPLKNLAKFGYKLNMRTKKFTHSTFCSGKLINDD